MKFSKFGEKFTKKSGILELMDDLGNALSGSEKKYMLGGGNPAHIPQVQEMFRKRMSEILSNDREYEKMVGNYDGPQGKTEFLDKFAKFLNRNFGWNVTGKNIAITTGSQTGFFYLFNLLAGEMPDGRKKKILLPLCPEYIGYADQGLSDDLFISYRPKIEHIDKHTFKYKVDFDNLKITDDIAAICVSRPTNPTGNVLSDDEIARLDKLAKEHNIPFIIDNAYGNPFPSIIFSDTNPTWNENIILSMSLSKIGLPSTRTGIFVANEEIVNAISSINAIVALSNGSIGQTIAAPLFENDSMIEMSKNHIRPFYEKKSQTAQDLIKKYFDDSLPYHVHKSEGALFLWLWFENLPITTKELYNRLKARNVIVVPGEYFFPGISEPWQQQNECIRISFAMDLVDVEEGIRIIGEEIKKAYANK